MGKRFRGLGFRGMSEKVGKVEKSRHHPEFMVCRVSFKLYFFPDCYNDIMSFILLRNILIFCFYTKTVRNSIVNIENSQKRPLT